VAAVVELEVASPFTFCSTNICLTWVVFALAKELDDWFDC